MNGIDAAIVGASVAAAGVEVGIGAPQAARIMDIAAISKVIRNKLRYIIFLLSI
jgi:hypothetical protein